jgi:hypothetical protein
MKITFETHERTGEWYCILWTGDGGQKIWHEIGATAKEAEDKMKATFNSLFKR